MENSISRQNVNVNVRAVVTDPNVTVQYKTKVLQKNVVSGVNTLTPAMISEANTKYIIKYDYILSDNITIPANCVLEFDGGSISGEHTITGNNTGIQVGLVKIFNTNVTLAGSWNVVEVYPEWFGAVGDGITDDTIYVQKCIAIAPIIKAIAYFSGIYYISSTISVGINTTIKGKSKEYSKIVTDKSIVMLEAKFTVSDGYFCNISDLTFDGNSIALSAIWFEKVQGDSLIKDVLINNFVDKGFVYGGWCWTGSMIRVWFNNCNTAIYCLGGTNDILFDDCNILGAEVGIWFVTPPATLGRLLSSGQNRITNCVFQSISHSSIRISNYARYMGLEVYGGYFEQIACLLYTENYNNTEPIEAIHGILFSGCFAYLGSYSTVHNAIFVSNGKLSYLNIESCNFSTSYSENNEIKTINNIIKRSLDTTYINVSKNYISSQPSSFIDVSHWSDIILHGNNYIASPAFMADVNFGTHFISNIKIQEYNNNLNKENGSLFKKGNSLVLYNGYNLNDANGYNPSININQVVGAGATVELLNYNEVFKGLVSFDGALVSLAQNSGEGNIIITVAYRTYPGSNSVTKTLYEGTLSNMLDSINRTSISANITNAYNMVISATNNTTQSVQTVMKVDFGNRN